MLMRSFDFSFTPSKGPSSSDAAAQGREVVSILEQGGYTAPSGRRVDLTADIAKAVSASRDYPAAESVPMPSPAASPWETKFSVTNGTSIAAAHAFSQSRSDQPLVLNFASARNPGGGFRGGARAQEESLARSSTLYSAIEKSAMYPFHRARRDCLYTSFMIHSPHVTVFRDSETGALLETPYACAFLTAPAPNAGVVLERDASRAEEVRAAMAERVRRALAICALHGHRRLVLGAWGCGVFRNEPEHVAECFARELDGPFAGIFEEIVFAVLDWSETRHFVRPFVKRFVR